MHNILIWLRNDLRLHDHEPIFRAFQKTDNVFLCYCIDTQLFEEITFGKQKAGFKKMGEFRTQFLLESLLDLRQNLQKLGGTLIIRVGNPAEIITQIAQELECKAVYTHQEITYEETQMEEKVEKNLWQQKISFEKFWGSTLYHIDDLPFPIRALPDIFTQFRKNIENYVKIRPAFPTPTKFYLPNIEERILPTLEELGFEKENIKKISQKAVLPFEGGETAGKKRLDEYFWEKNLLKIYKETRNGLLGADYSSKFSVWLALGCISPRYIYEQVLLYEKQRTKNESTYWLIFELIWRDYFKLIAKKYGNAIFKTKGIKNTSNLILKKDFLAFEKWKNGNTGVDFVDANMQELALTGFMSNRGRQNVASFLIKDLFVHWVWGAKYFESQLLDYDVCSNWGNWTYIAGVGNDPRENRYFSIPKQASMYDPKGEYVRFWLE
jgi:deoxyribodipyrimidine photo-lyase